MTDAFREHQQEIADVEAAIAALEAQRPVLGDHVVDTALEPLREKLATLVQPDQAPDERKRVTVLFADVSGYTALSENLDPEDVASTMNRLFEAVTVAIHRYGGTVDKYSGDAVMALFGAPQALENHEEMAVRAALAIQKVLTEFSARLEQERGFRLRMRIGLNTGQVLAGLIGGAQARSYTVMGDTVNLASRLEHACPVGRIMISAETARPLHPIFDFEPPQQITVKGKSDPVTVYLVVGEKAERGRVRGLAGLHAPLVGREAEMESLQETFNFVIEEGGWQATAVTGDAGIGKSRLQREFVAWAMEQPAQTRLLTGRCYAHTKTSPYSFVADLVRALFNLDPDLNSETAIRKISNELRTLEPDLDETEIDYQLGSLAGVLGLTMAADPLSSLDPEQRRDRTFLSLERIFSAASTHAPLLILVIDLHWADTLSQAFLKRLLQMMERNSFAGQTAMFLILSRPSEDPHSTLAQLLTRLEQPPHRTLALTALDSDHAEALVSALLDQDLPADLLQLVIGHAQGNPFYVEEILRSFIEDGTLKRKAGGQWLVTRSVSDVKIPPSVQDVLAARIDRLPPPHKRITQHAAIIGRTFWQQLLAQITEAETVESTLVLLEVRQLAERLGQSQIVEDWEWVFHHVLIQEVAYASVPKALRRTIHREVAHVLEEQLNHQTAFLLPLIAYHYEQGNVTEKAVRYLGEAGKQAAIQFANNDAIDYFSRALTLINEASIEIRQAISIQEQRYTLLLGREAVYGLSGQQEAQAGDLIQLQTLAEELDNDHYRAEAALRFANYYESISDFATALMAAKKAVQWAEKASDSRRKVEGLIAWGLALWRQGDLEEARRQLEKTLALAREQENRPGEATSLHHLGTVLYYLGDHEGARDHIEQALTIRRQLGDFLGEAKSLNNLVAVYHALGDFAKGKSCCQQALTIYRTIGNQREEATSLNNLAAIQQTLGDLLAARDYLQRASSLYQTLDNRQGEALAANNLGLVFHDLGDHEAAKYHCTRALKINRAIGDKIGEGYSLTYFGLALEGLKEWAAATDAYREALHLRRKIGQTARAIDDLAGLARVALREQRVTEALMRVKEVLSWIEAHGVHGMEYPLRVYMTCYDVLVAAGQEKQATEVLTTAHSLLQEQAARISHEPTRRAFLEQVPLHRQLRRRLWQLDHAE